MLTELRVRDLAVIADVTLKLRPGLNVLTGETGAGKSMLVDALALLLGERANADMVRPGAPRTVVEAAFDLSAPSATPATSAASAASAAAQELGIDLEDDQLVVRRDINAEGRNRAWANGSPATVGALATIGQLLVDLHGQHEAQSLLKPAEQRDILDAFGDAGPEREAVARAYAQAAALRDQERQLADRVEEIQRRADYLRHVVQEISSAQPRVGEDEHLAIESKRLSNVEELTRLAERVAGLLDGEQGAALEALAQASRTLDQLERIDAGVARWRELLDQAYAGTEELARVVRGYASEIEMDPGRLEAVERRRDVLYRLTQKYGPTIHDVIRFGQETQRELSLLDTADDDLKALAERRAAADAALEEAGGRLTAKRTTAAATLARAVEGLLPGLGMPGGKFEVRLSTGGAVTQAGADEVVFLVQLNVGLDARPLAQVASGGELSRLMLALKVVLTRHDKVPTLVFDEVDQGIGGEVAMQVGEALSQVAASRQVLVITHLPQIAAQASQHLVVSKQPKGGIATADVRVVNGEERVDEIARMLGGAGDPVARRHAAELLKKRAKAASVGG
ncbi:MAG TPA: DNA repair protein RecN [Gemmatimonadales bacterium]|nr:DNA repair protein RecN [Gemmatimonadales bacterium]